MRKVVLIVLISIIVSTWITLTDFEFGKYDSFEEVLEKGIPYKVKDVIHTQNVDGVNVVMYTTKPDRSKLPFANYDALAVAFLEGNNDDGWENIGPNEWTHYDNHNLNVYMGSLHDYDWQGNVRHELYVVFGEINNPEIVRIETKTKEGTFKAATIITNRGKRYFLHVGRERIVRGISKEGEVISQQGG
jgi:hypothetical protein